MAKYDLEALLADVEALLKTKLNDKLDAIATDKNDGITCPHIDATLGYIQQSLDARVMNLAQFVFYGVENITTIAIKGGSANQYTLDILVLVSDDGGDKDKLKKLLRYQRALKEIFEENYGAFPSGQMTVTSGIPQDIKLIDSSNSYRVIGIFVEIAIA